MKAEKTPRTPKSTSARARTKVEWVDTFSIHVEGAMKLQNTQCGSTYMEMFSWCVEVDRPTLDDSGFVLKAEEIQAIMSTPPSTYSAGFKTPAPALSCEEIAQWYLIKLSRELLTTRTAHSVLVRISPGVPPSGRYVEAKRVFKKKR